MVKVKVELSLKTLLEAYKKMVSISEMARLYDENRKIANIVHSTSRGHEGIQLAVGMQLLPQDYVYPYYRDDAMLLGIGLEPFDLIRQLLAKKTDPMTGGKMYYSHPALKRDDMPKIPFQSSGVAMQAIPATGAAHGIKYKEKTGLAKYENGKLPPVVICSMGDGAITEGEVSEAFIEASINQLPIIYVIQDNDWAITSKKEEVYNINADEFVKGFPGIEYVCVDGTNFIDSYAKFAEVLEIVRKERRPFLVHARTALLNHHTSGVRKEWYRDPEEIQKLMETKDPRKILRNELLDIGVSEKKLQQLEEEIRKETEKQFWKAVEEPDPEPSDLYSPIYAETPIKEEQGERTPQNGKKIVMVDAALHACEEILRKHPEALFYGQDVGGKIGGVFREAATLKEKFGPERVFSTPIQEAYIVGSTGGMSAVGCKPIVEIQFADFIWPAINQLVSEISKAYYLSDGKWNVSAVIRIPTGAYGQGGPYHSSSIESFISLIKGLKVVFPSNAADLKGLLKSAFYDPNPVIVFEHKGLYWSKVPGTEAAKTIEPDENYVIPIGKANTILKAEDSQIEIGNSCAVITYGMGVHWALNAAKDFPGSVEILDLRSLMPYDWEAITETVKRHNKVLLLTEEPKTGSFMQALAGRIANELFEFLDIPPQILAAPDVPGIPPSKVLEDEYLPGTERTKLAIQKLLEW